MSTHAGPHITGILGHGIVTVGLNPTIDRVLEVPGFHTGGHLVGQLRLRTPAGKAFNVARVLAALGVPSGALGWVGQDSLDLFQKAAKRDGVAAHFTPIAGATRENITILDPQTPSETHIRDRGPTVTAGEITQLLQDLGRHAVGDRIVVFTGSLANGLSSSQYAEILRLCSGGGAKVVVDTSGEALDIAAKQSPWMIKPNLDELGDLLGRPVQTDEEIIHAGRKLNRQIPLVVITQGARGALCFHEGQVWHGGVAIPPGRIRSTVGCGDAFLGGFLAELVRSAGSIEAALRQAVAVAAASALDDLPATFRREDLDAIHPQVVLKRVE